MHHCTEKIVSKCPATEVTSLFAVGGQIGDTLGVLVGHDGGAAGGAASDRGGVGATSRSSARGGVGATSGSGAARGVGATSRSSTARDVLSAARGARHVPRAARAGGTNSTTVQDANHRLSRSHSAVLVLRGSLDPVVLGWGRNGGVTWGFLGRMRRFS